MAKSKLNPDHTTPEKICTVCRESKPRTSVYFPLNKKCRDGLGGTCRLCNTASLRKSGSSKKYYHKDIEKSRKRGRDKYWENPEKCRADVQAWRDLHPGYQKEWSQENPDYFNNKRRDDIQYRIACNLRTRLGMAIKTGAKAGSAVSDLGCTVKEVIDYLESKFTIGMTWDNYGFGSDKWNIDHIRPLSSYDLTDRAQLLQAANWTNLQPMWHLDNIRKNATYNQTEGEPNGK